MRTYNRLLYGVKDPKFQNTQKYVRYSNVKKIRIGAIEIWIFETFWPFISLITFSTL